MEKTAKILRENKCRNYEIWQNQVVQKYNASRKTDAIALYNHTTKISKPNIAQINDTLRSWRVSVRDKKYKIEIIKSVRPCKHSGHYSLLYGFLNRLYTNNNNLSPYIWVNSLIATMVIMKSFGFGSIMYLHLDY